MKYKSIITLLLALLTTSIAQANDETPKHDMEVARQRKILAEEQNKRKAAQEAEFKAALKKANDDKRDKALNDLIKTLPNSTPKPKK